MRDWLTDPFVEDGPLLDGVDDEHNQGAAVNMPGHTGKTKVVQLIHTAWQLPKMPNGLVA